MEEIYPEKNFDDVRFRKLRSDLLKLIEGFLAQQIFEDNPMHQATYLIEAIGKNKMTKLNESSIRSARRLATSHIHKPSDYYYFQYKIERNYFNLSKQELRKGTNEFVIDVGNNLDRFYLAEKLKYYCFILNSEQFFSHEYKHLFIDEIISHIEKHNYDHVPPVAVYYQIYLMLTDSNDENHYFKLKELLNNYGEVFPSDDAQIIYEHALNYCIRKINKGNLSFYEETFHIYSVLLDNELIYDEGELAPWHYLNIVASSLRMGKFEWVENFIKNYSHRLPTDQRDNAKSYNLARLYFYQKRYDEVISLLQTVEYDDIVYNLGSKTMLIRIYYEMDEIDALDSLLESFRIYLGRQRKLSDQRKKNYKAFIRFIKRLSRVIPGDEKAIKKIREEFDRSEGIVSTDEWLREKIEALEGG